MWWEKTEESLLSGAKILSLILYSDVTNVDTLGKSNLHPIYVSITRQSVILKIGDVTNQMPNNY